MLNIFSLFKSKPKAQQQILFFCGAGISQESGLQTFRDSHGLWSQHDINTICNLKTVKDNRKEVFSFYNQRKIEILNALPNQAHYALAEIQKKYGINNVHIFTSNIDNLLEKAGCKNVCYIHENIFGMTCLECNHHWDIGNKMYDIHEKCPICQHHNTKPSIIFFHESAPKYKILREFFEKSGPVINKKIIPNIKVIVGTSFKVIKPDIFKIERSRSILVDSKEIHLGGFEQKIIAPATEGLLKAHHLIEHWYHHNN